jgi:hypothetical protein
VAAGSAIIDGQGRRRLAPNGKWLVATAASSDPCGCCEACGVCDPPVERVLVSITGLILRPEVVDLGSGYWAQWADPDDDFDGTHCLECNVAAPGETTVNAFGLLVNRTLNIYDDAGGTNLVFTLTNWYIQIQVGGSSIWTVRVQADTAGTPGLFPANVHAADFFEFDANTAPTCVSWTHVEGNPNTLASDQGTWDATMDGC